MSPLLGSEQLEPPEKKTFAAHILKVAKMKILAALGWGHSCFFSIKRVKLSCLNPCVSPEQDLRQEELDSIFGLGIYIYMYILYIYILYYIYTKRFSGMMKSPIQIPDFF